VSQQSPIRYPDTRDRSVMTTRAWWLVGLNLVLPGSAQLLAGDTRLGRFGVRATILSWVLGVTLLVLWNVQRGFVYAIATSSIALIVAEVLLVGYAVLWVVLTVDTLRLVRLVRLWPAARGVVATVALVGMLGVVGGAGYAAIVSGASRSVVETVFAGQVVEPPVDGRYNILVLGGDAGKDRTGLRPDSIQIVSVDATTGSTTIIGVPRNLEHAPFAAGSPLWVPFPNGYDCGNDCLISYLYTYAHEHPDLYPDAKDPGVEATKDAVEGVTGITIQYYVLVDMGGFSKLIDALGGVTIDATSRLPIGGSDGSDGKPIVKPQGYIEPGVQKMNGRTALWYARSRHSTNDYDRMARQHQLEQAILAQFEPAVVLTHFQSIAEAGKHIATTNIPQGTLGRFVELADLARGHKVATLELVPDNGFSSANPDFEAIRTAVHDALAPQPSPPPSNC
jgi:polyisoprenyl-teichoic acid--peptidoglycan teichoic acid transferase